MCATSEGFADFVAAAANWDNNELSVWLRSTSLTLEGHTTFQNPSPLDCVAYSNANNEGMRGNVARFFWDLYDSTSVDDTRGSWTDNTTWSFDYILEQWDEFDPGTGNRDAKEDLIGSESTWPGNDGRNVRDYYHHATGSYSEMGLNCLDDQQND